MLFAKSGPIVVKKILNILAISVLLSTLPPYKNEMIGVAGMFKMFHVSAMLLRCATNNLL